jgi:Threonine dehydrogenase and related Zn-dependent dehydrogenases
MEALSFAKKAIVMSFAQALICDDQQRFSLETFELPQIKPDEILIETIYSGVSVGTEFALVRKKLDWGPFPLCTGYQAVGRVSAVGSQVEGYSVGDKVYYRRNYLPMELRGQRVNTAAGTHCSHAIIAPSKAEGIAHLPANADEMLSSTFVLPAVGFNAVDMAGVRMGDRVLVQGMGPIGLGALLAANLRGAVTIGVDLSPARLALASRLGIDHVLDASSGDLRAQVEAIAPGGADVVFEGTGVAANLDTAFQLVRKRGSFVFLGNYGNAPISYHFLVPHGKELTAFYPCNDGLAPARRAVIKLIASGALPWGRTISHVVNAEQAPEFFTAINHNQVPDLLCAVIRWAKN